MPQNKPRGKKPHATPEKIKKVSPVKKMMNVARRGAKQKEPGGPGIKPQQPTREYELSGSRPSARGNHDGQTVKKSKKKELKKLKLQKR